jgi:hypothetical protein
VRFQRGRLTIIRCSSAGRRTYPSVVSVCRRRPDFRVNDAQPGLAAGAETGIAPSAPGRLRCGHRGHRGLILLPVRLRRVRHPYRLGRTAPPLRSSSSASAAPIDGNGPPRSRAARRSAATNRSSESVVAAGRRYCSRDRHQGACLSCNFAVPICPIASPQAGTLTVICTVPARVFGSHM